MESAQEYDDALALFREHWFYLTDLPTKMTLRQATDEKPVRVGEFDKDLMLLLGDPVLFPLTLGCSRMKASTSSIAAVAPAGLVMAKDAGVNHPGTG